MYIRQEFMQTLSTLSPVNKEINIVGFEVLTAVSTKMAVF
jgi:hypothetical protein